MNCLPWSDISDFGMFTLDLLHAYTIYADKKLKTIQLLRYNIITNEYKMTFTHIKL